MALISWVLVVLNVGPTMGVPSVPIELDCTEPVPDFPERELDCLFR